ncbi:MAG: Isoquinoline 1-oxidoreductase beta subunit, partial [uncultured Sphingomonadaceae bacterium]
KACATGFALSLWQSSERRAATPPSTTFRGTGSTRTARPEAEAFAVDGAVPPYGVAAVVVEHVPVDVGAPSGVWRGRAHGYTAFFTECFVDELARKAGAEPFSFRMGMLGGNPRFARVLSAAAALGQWDGGGAGSVQGIAAHAMAGSIAAAVVEAGVGADGRIRVSRVSMVVDVGRVINPDLVRQQVEGGILWGIAAATGSPIDHRGGLPSARTLSELGLPHLTDTPDMRIEILPSLEAPGGAEEIAVPPIAPAIANAIFAATGQRLRSLPLVMGGR